MKSIRELAQKFNCNAFALNKLLLKWEIPIHTEFGKDDGFISDDLAEFIQEQTTELKQKALNYNEIVGMKIDHVPLDAKNNYVYFLIRDNIIVYVGQTVCLMNRISEHLKSKKEFNYISFIEVNKRWLLRTESHYIMQFNPEHNISGVNTINFFEIILKSYNG